MGKPTTTAGRVSFPSVYKPDTFGDAEPKYKITLLFDPGDPCLTEIDAAIDKAIREKWGEKAPAKSSLRLPYQNGDDVGYDGYAGKTAVKFSNRNRPGVVDARLNDITEESNDFYAGCLAKVSYEAYAYDNVSKGVLLTFYNVQKVADGDRLGGGFSDPTDDFDVIEDQFDEAMLD